MKICPNCNVELSDEAAFCKSCGTQVGGAQGANPNPPQYNYAPAYNPYDHTAEFDPKDISDNKVFAMLVYLMGVFGIIIALLAGQKSDYVMFHVRQGLKLTAVSLLAGIVAALSLVVAIIPILGWLVCGLVWLGYLVLSCAIFVIQIICFFQICSGKAKEPAIVRNLPFLK